MKPRSLQPWREDAGAVGVWLRAAPRAAILQLTARFGFLARAVAFLACLVSWLVSSAAFACARLFTSALAASCSTVAPRCSLVCSISARRRATSSLPGGIRVPSCTAGFSGGVPLMTGAPSP